VPGFCYAKQKGDLAITRLCDAAGLIFNINQRTALKSDLNLAISVQLLCPGNISIQTLIP
jgi:hypothetical protein